MKNRKTSHARFPRHLQATTPLPAESEGTLYQPTLGYKRPDSNVISNLVQNFLKPQYDQTAYVPPISRQRLARRAPKTSTP